MAKKTPPRSDDDLALAQALADLAYKKKAEDLVILDVRGLHTEIDYFVLATAGSRLAAVIGEEAVQWVKQHRPAARRHLEASEDWICGDFGAVVLHVFTPDSREFYGLEHLWGDARRVPFHPSVEDSLVG